jgi:hypothetical protein
MWQSCLLAAAAAAAAAVAALERCWLLLFVSVPGLSATLCNSQLSFVQAGRRMLFVDLGQTHTDWHSDRSILDCYQSCTATQYTTGVLVAQDRQQHV